MLRFLRRDRGNDDDLQPCETTPVMRVAVIDVGANTVRLLVAEQHAGVASPLEEDKEQLSLGAEVERDGRISGPLVDATADVVRRFAARARTLGAAQVAVLVTSPGRQAENGGDLVAALSRAASTQARVLRAEEEGALAFRGATTALDPIDGDTLVCDVGGGSTQLVLGTSPDDISWWASLDIGSLRLTSRFGLDAPELTAETLERARIEVAALVAPLALPVAARVLATGGTARALHKMFGRTLRLEELQRGVMLALERKPRDVADDYGISRRRAERLLGGTLILEAIEARLGAPFEVATGGIREGAVLTLLATELAA
jgi:exopolyphosphatase/guanosine-5'-triphosphate,3'-diphosphate pyrophosphatase